MYFNIFAWDGVGLARNVGFVAVAVVIVYCFCNRSRLRNDSPCYMTDTWVNIKEASIFLCIEPWRTDVLLDRWLDGSQKSYGMIQFH